MFYLCGCGFTCTTWDDYTKHKQSCGGKPVDIDPPEVGIGKLPEKEKVGLEKWLK